jgi:arylsulfatase A-like enzyme
MLDRFHNALAAVDAATGALVDGLRARSVWDQTALVVVADHGEAFYEHGLPTHGTTLHEEQVRVPLLLRLPGAAPRVVAEPVSVLDALPTLYRAMGLGRHGALQGRDDLLAPSYDGRRRPITFTIQGMTHADGVLFGDWKWIVNRDRGDGALYQLASDPEERRDLARAEPERRRALAGLLEELLRSQVGYYSARGWEQGWYPPRLP